MAKYYSSCLMCPQPIKPGQQISYSYPHKKFVHAMCHRRAFGPPRVIPFRANRCQPIQANDQILTRSAKAELVLQRISSSYQSEVRRWIDFHNGEPVPGIDAEFNTQGLQDYLSYRATTTKGLAGILSALKQMGMLAKFELHSSKFQQPSLMYQELQFHIHRLEKEARLQGKIKGANAAVGVGRFGNGLLLSGFSCFSYKMFKRLAPIHQECIGILSFLYRGGGGRFGLFQFTVPQHIHLTFAAHINAFRLEATWRKTHKSNTPYTITVPLDPTEDCPGFLVQHPTGPTRVTAGTLIHWYLQANDSNETTEDDPIFPIFAAAKDRRGLFTAWLRSMFTMVLPHGSTIPRRIRPHSLRAGWVNDRVRAKVPAETIMAEGRWASKAAMLTYIRAIIRDLLHSDNFRYIPKTVRHSWRF